MPDGLRRNGRLLKKFKAYLDDYPSDMISKDVAIDELSDALDDVEFEEIDDV